MSQWPQLIDLTCGETCTVTTVQGDRTVRLRAVEETWMPDHWIRNNPARRVLAAANVMVDVGGVEATLRAGPFQMPVVVNGLRLYVEATANWARACEAPRIEGVEKDVRLSVGDAGLAWGPPDLIFPIRDYRWRAATYNNTWSALVPYNRLYYHRGEDYGAIPDSLDVVAIMDGTVAASPLPTARDANAVHILSPSGVYISYAHMNIEHIAPDLVVGAEVKAGQLLGKTGATWKGRRSQTHDPHLHVSFHRGDPSQAEPTPAESNVFSSYPFLVSAYFNSYADPVLPVAGGYHFTEVNRTVTLDGRNSLARPGRTIDAYTWHLHDGRVVRNGCAEIRYSQPGLYSEMLVVQTSDGHEDRDFAQVRVYDPQQGKELAYGWAYYTPLRNIRPHTPVRFWNRLRNTVGPVYISFGDGAPAQVIGDETTYAYADPGLYTVGLTGRGPQGEPITVNMRVFVES